MKWKDTYILLFERKGRITWQIFQAWKISYIPRGYPSRSPLQNVGVDITGVRLPILEQQCDQFFSSRLRKPVQSIEFGAKQQT